MPDQRNLAMNLMDQHKFSEAIPLFKHLINRISSSADPAQCQ